jgi:ChrR Cupin-like domain
VVPAGDGWQPLREGVELRPLHRQGEAITALARFQGGARVPAHPHGIDEECLMVEGDLFLGDVLLPEGGFQFAPGGSAHGELFADMPCLLYFHGAIDPHAVDNGHRVRLGYAAL